MRLDPEERVFDNVFKDELLRKVTEAIALVNKMEQTSKTNSILEDLNFVKFKLETL